MNAETYFGGAQEADLSGGDVSVYPHMGRCVRAYGTSTPDTKVKLPALTARSARGGDIFAVWNDTLVQIQIARSTGTNVQALTAGQVGLVSYAGSVWQVHVM